MNVGSASLYPSMKLYGRNDSNFQKICPSASWVSQEILPSTCLISWESDNSSPGDTHQELLVKPNPLAAMGAYRKSGNKQLEDDNHSRKKCFTKSPKQSIFIEVISSYQHKQKGSCMIGFYRNIHIDENFC